jgi:hypothetical protein
MRLNENRFERKLGLIFMLIWLAIFAFYLTWDGWLYEWRECGYKGQNQHFDLDLFDMRYSYDGAGGIIYHSTNNLHNLIYLCYLIFFLGWFGLLFDIEWAKQWTMATMGISVVAALSTLRLSDHLYVLQIVYDIVHLSGIAIGFYLFWKYDLKIKRAVQAIMATWIVYMLSHLFFTPWPFWQNQGMAYYSINQINDLPFFLFGLEYLIVVFLLIGIDFVTIRVNSKLQNGLSKTLVPLGLYVLLCVTLIALGLIIVPDLSMNTCSVIG